MLEYFIAFFNIFHTHISKCSLFNFKKYDLSGKFVLITICFLAIFFELSFIMFFISFNKSNFCFLYVESTICTIHRIESKIFVNFLNDVKL